MNSVRLAACH
uniref:Uncharacterized protein n=1 Tax=Ficus carica TaxID=3494 RepID=A0AA88JJP3_FICCA|nr:hypothetical protein TIFTF001_056364 [Ficus carica]GMN75771.1 hypothetical protein TIFTF001_056366 [Ficus carica]